MRIELKRPTSVGVLVIACVISFVGLAFLAALLAGRLGIANAYITLAIQIGGLSREILAGTREWWRVVSTMLLHVDLIHLLVNMWSLWQMGTLVRLFFGERAAVVTFFYAGLGGSALTLLLGPALVPTLGASGAIFGLLGLLFMASWKGSRGTGFPIPWQDFAPLLIFSLLYGFAPGSGINNLAHIGGLIVGGALGWVYPAKPAHLSQRAQQVEAVAYWVAVLALAFTFVVMWGLFLFSLLGQS